MRGLQAWKAYMGKNNSSTSLRLAFPSSLFLPLQASPRGRRDQFSSSLPTPPEVSCCWMCVYICALVSSFFLTVEDRKKDFWGLFHTQGRRKIPLYPYFLTPFPLVLLFSFGSAWHLFSIPSLSSYSLPSALYLFLSVFILLSSLCSSSISFRGVCK